MLPSSTISHFYKNDSNKNSVDKNGIITSSIYKLKNQSRLITDSSKFNSKIENFKPSEQSQTSSKFRRTSNSDL